MQELRGFSSVWTGDPETTFYDSIFSNLAQEYQQIQRSLIFSSAVDANEFAFLQTRINGALPKFYQCKARADIAILLYRQGRRSEARTTLRLIAVALANNSLETIALKVRAALIMAAAGDIHTAYNTVLCLYTATKSFPINLPLEIEVLPFFETLSKKHLQMLQTC